MACYCSKRFENILFSHYFPLCSHCYYIPLQCSVNEQEASLWKFLKKCVHNRSIRVRSLDHILVGPHIISYILYNYPTWVFFTFLFKKMWFHCPNAHILESWKFFKSTCNTTQSNMGRLIHFLKSFSSILFFSHAVTFLCNIVILGLTDVNRVQ